MRRPQLADPVAFGILAVTTAAWAFNFVAAKFALPEIPPPALMLLRMVLMMPLLVLVAKAMGAPLSVPKEDRARVFWGGFISNGVYMILFFEGLAMASSTQAATAMAMIPLFTATLAVLLHEEPFSWRLLLGSLTAFGGVAMIILAGEESGVGSATGTLIVIAGAGLWAVAVVVLRPVLGKRSPVTVLTLGMPPALLVLVPYGLFSMLTLDYSAISTGAWLGFSYTTVVAGVVAFLGFWAGVGRVGSARATFVQYFIPPLSAVFAFLVLGHPITWMKAAGLVVVIAGVYVASRRVPVVVKREGVHDLSS